MRAFSVDELSRMQDTQESAMMDTCQITRRVEAGFDPYGYPIDSYDDVVYTGVCGFDPSSDREVMEGTQVSVVDAVVRLPLATIDDFDNLDRVKITYRFGVDLSEPEVFEIIGSPERGPSGLVLDLRIVTDGSGV